jgi:hypothetical protein
MSRNRHSPYALNAWPRTMLRARGRANHPCEWRCVFASVTRRCGGDSRQGVTLGCNRNRWCLTRCTQPALCRTCTPARRSSPPSPPLGWLGSARPRSCWSVRSQSAASHPYTQPTQPVSSSARCLALHTPTQSEGCGTCEQRSTQLVSTQRGGGERPRTWGSLSAAEPATTA